MFANKSHFNKKNIYIWYMRGIPKNSHSLIHFTHFLNWSSNSVILNRIWKYLWGKMLHAQLYRGKHACLGIKKSIQTKYLSSYKLNIYTSYLNTQIKQVCPINTFLEILQFDLLLWYWSTLSGIDLWKHW